jgi:hypothetical protein
MKKIILASLFIGIGFAGQAQNSAKKTVAVDNSASHTGQVLPTPVQPATKFPSLPVPLPAPPKATPTPPKATPAPPKATPAPPKAPVVPPKTKK